MSDNENKDLCPSCVHSILCNTWGQFKCRAGATYVYKDMTDCRSYKKRPKDFKETDCQCEDCMARSKEEMQ